MLAFPVILGSPILFISPAFGALRWEGLRCKFLFNVCCCTIGMENLAFVLECGIDSPQDQHSHAVKAESGKS